MVLGYKMCASIMQINVQMICLKHLSIYCPAWWQRAPVASGKTIMQMLISQSKNNNGTFPSQLNIYINTSKISVSIHYL